MNSKSSILLLLLALQVSLIGCAGNPTDSLIVPKSTYAYVAGAESQASKAVTITGYLINADTGALSTLTGPTTTLPDGLIKMLSSAQPAGAFLFTLSSDGINSNVRSFKVKAGTGVLAPVQEIILRNTEGSGLPILAIHPSGKFLYAQRSDFRNNRLCVVAYRIDPYTGNLTERSCSAGELQTLVFAPPGDFAYGNANDGALGGYIVNQDDGSLTSLEGAIPDTTVSALASDPRGLALYTLRLDYYGCALLESWTINSQSGSLIFAGSIPQTNLGPSCTPGYTIFTPSGDFAYLYYTPGHYPHYANESFALSVDRTTGNLTVIGAAGGSGLPAIEPSHGKLMISINSYQGLVSQFIDPQTGILSQTVSTIPLPQPSPDALIVVAPAK